MTIIIIIIIIAMIITIQNVRIRVTLLQRCCRDTDVMMTNNKYTVNVNTGNTEIHYNITVIRNFLHHI